MRVLSRDELRLDAHRAGLPWRVAEGPAWREALRAHLAAEGAMLRRTLIDRALRWADAPADDALRDELARLVEDLDDVGDAALGSGGLVGATAPRLAVVLGTDTALALGSAPTWVFARALGVAVEARRVRRVVLPQRDPSALDAAMASMGGRVIDASRWVGLDRAPESPEAWRAELLDRAPLEGDDAREWSEADTQRMALDGARVRWRDGATGDGLLRRSDAGWPRFAHRHEGGVRALTRDEAQRTELAARSASGALPTVRASAEAGSVRFTLGARLPRAEYRLLLGTADRVDGDAWVVPQSAWSALAAMLRERLAWPVDESALRGGESR